MISIDIRLNGDGAFNDIPPAKLVEATGEMRVAALTGGMRSGKPAVAVGLLFPDGGCVFSQTSLALFLSAADALKARYGDPRT